MNIELLERIAAHIEANAKTFDMSTFYDPCGSTCCIAGEAVRMTSAVMFNRLRELAEKEGPYSSNAEWSDAGRDALQIDEMMATRLFHAFEWPEPFRTQYEDVLMARDSTKGATIGVARIKHFIATEGRE